MLASRERGSKQNLAILFASKKNITPRGECFFFVIARPVKDAYVPPKRSKPFVVPFLRVKVASDTHLLGFFWVSKRDSMSFI